LIIYKLITNFADNRAIK